MEVSKEGSKRGLLLKRNLGEAIVVGDAVIRVIEIGKKTVRLAIQAPQNIRILREELKDKGV